MNSREREIINGAQGQLRHALALMPNEPPDEDTARGWIEAALRELGKLLPYEDVHRAELAAEWARMQEIADDIAGDGEQ